MTQFSVTSLEDSKNLTRLRQLSSIAILVRVETLQCISYYFLNRCVTSKVTLYINA